MPHVPPISVNKHQATYERAFHSIPVPAPIRSLNPNTDSEYHPASDIRSDPLAGVDAQ